MQPQILFEDNFVLVVDKPSGLVVNRADSVKEPTLQDWVEEYLKLEVGSKNVERTSMADFISRSGIVHRIDKETSGILIIAKNEEAFIELQRQFKEREIEKTYLALVHGKFEITSGIINAAVGRLPWNRERFGILAGGRESETRYKLLRTLRLKPSVSLIPSAKRKGNKVLSNEWYSLVEFYPKTGRTHQIRVHSKYIHHPLVGDSFYAGRKTSKEDRTWCPRLFLHAKAIKFTHPKTKERVEIKSDLPKDLQTALSSFDS